MIINSTFQAKERPRVIRRGEYVSIETVGTATDRIGHTVTALRIEEFQARSTIHALTLAETIEKKIFDLCRIRPDPGIIGRDKHNFLFGLGYSIGFIRKDK